MLTIDLNELENRLKPIIGTINLIEPIGNHDLERHLVYRLSCGSKDYVIKLYYKKNRWNREVACLKLFSNTEVLVPKVVDYGVFDNGLEWLIYDFIEGDLLSKVIDKLPVENLKEIYYDMGIQLGMIHHHKQFDYFGNMVENDGSIQGFTTFREYFEDLMSRNLLELYSSEHKNYLLLKEAEIQIKSMYSLLDEVDKATLCHNDFAPRNVLIEKIDNKYYLKAIIDFERCLPGDVDEELIYIYLPLVEKSNVLAEGFKLGYEQYGNINLYKLSLKKDFYNLYKGLGICTWAKDNAYDYYLEGIKILEDTMTKFR